MGPKYKIAARSRFDETLIEISRIEWAKTCVHCAALLLKCEAPSLCCMGGKVEVEPLSVPSETEHPEIAHLYTGSSEIAKLFRENALAFNQAFSFGCRSANQANYGRTFPAVAVTGLLYQKFAGILPIQGQQPQYAQIYTLEPHEQLQRRMELFRGTGRLRAFSAEIFSYVQRFLLSENNYATLYKRLATTMTDTDSYFFHFFDPNGRSQLRTYNRPRHEEIAGVYDDTRSDSTYVSVTGTLRGGEIKEFSYLSQHYGPLCYPLIHLRGETDWHRYLQLTNSRRLTLCMWLRNMIMVRRERPSRILCLPALLPMWSVDQILRHIRFQAEWYNQNQSRIHIRTARVRQLQDAENPPDQVGVRRVLTKANTGSPKWFQACRHDAMAVVKELGKPDLFVTMTCNPDWPEIASLTLKPGLTSAEKRHRIDIQSRVFNAKLSELKSEILVDGVLGKVSAHVSVIEWQKRGLPHCHMLLWFDPEDRVESPEDIDRIISARLPDSVASPVYRAAVEKFMIHGPCGRMRPNCPCMKRVRGGEPSCSKSYPKGFNDRTHIGDACYPLYARKAPDSGGHWYLTQDGVRVDDSYVVPHNPYLLVKYQCHINVEKVQSVRAILFRNFL